jgi:hypothetical protein
MSTYPLLGFRDKSGVEVKMVFRLSEIDWDELVGTGL